MASDNIELMHSLNREFNESGAEALSRYYDPEIEWHMGPGWVEKDAYIGLEEVTGELASAWIENFDEYRWDEHHLVELDERRVLGLYRHRGLIKGSAVPIDQPIGAIWEIRDAKLVRVHSYFSWEETLEAAGVSEEVLKA